VAHALTRRPALPPQLSQASVSMLLRVQGVVRVQQSDSVSLQLHSSLGILTASYSRTSGTTTLSVAKAAAFTSNNWQALGVATGGAAAGGANSANASPSPGKQCRSVATQCHPPAVTLHDTPS
jgi:hypothetical protein